MNTRKSINLLLMLACTLCLATVAHSQTAAQTQALRDANNGNWSAVFRALDGKTINPSIVDSNQDSLMHIAIRYPKDPSILDQLAARNVPLESQNKQGQTPFMVTMTNGAYINAIWLLKKGIQVGGKIDGMDTAQSLLRQHQILAKIYYDEARKRNRPVHPSYLADTLSMALFRGDEKSVLDKLVNGAVPETEDLDMAIFSENPNVLRMLADGFFISRQNVVELASQAAYAGATGSLDFLLGANLGIEVSNGKGDELAEPAMAGARNGALGPFTKTLQILLNHGYKPDSRMAAQALEKELDDESVKIGRAHV